MKLVWPRLLSTSIAQRVSRYFHVETRQLQSRRRTEVLYFLGTLACTSPANSPIFH